MQLTTTVVLSFLGLVSAQATLTIPDPGSVATDIGGGATSVIGDIGSGIDRATSTIGSEISEISSDLETATGSESSKLSTKLDSASSRLSSASDAAKTSNSDNPAPIQTAAVGLGALFGGAAVLAAL